jgi:hypothetical protein
MPRRSHRLRPETQLLAIQPCLNKLCQRDLGTPKHRPVPDLRQRFLDAFQAFSLRLCVLRQASSVLRDLGHLLSADNTVEN